MQKSSIVLTILLLGFFVGIVSSSGCIDTNKTGNVWGEKKISIDAIKISNNTTGNYSEQNESRYYVYGYLENDNPYEALNVKIRVTVFGYNGTEIAVNETPYIDPKSIPAQGESFFYARFSDPDKKITKYEVKIISAKAEY